MSLWHKTPPDKHEKLGALRTVLEKRFRIPGSRSDWPSNQKMSDAMTILKSERQLIRKCRASEKQSIEKPFPSIFEYKLGLDIRTINKTGYQILIFGGETRYHWYWALPLRFIFDTLPSKCVVFLMLSQTIVSHNLSFFISTHWNIICTLQSLTLYIVW